MDDKTPTQDDLRSKLKIMTIIFYLIFLVWIVILGVIIYYLIAGKEVTSLLIGTIPIVGVLMILGKIKTKIKKELNP